ncbi:MAG: BatD like domain, partial [Verrucomicrobiota bacterium]
MIFYKVSPSSLSPAILLRIVAMLLLTLGQNICLAAGNTKVTASLSDPSVAPGESTTLILSIENGGGLTEIPNLKATGLRIEFRGQSFQTRIENFSATQSLDLTYEVSGDAAGTYTIPATPVPTENGIFHTPPLQLVVQSGTQSRSNAATSLAEISFPKTSAYLGESIPAEIRLL